MVHVLRCQQTLGMSADDVADELVDLWINGEAVEKVVSPEQSQPAAATRVGDRGDVLETFVEVLQQTRDLFGDQRVPQAIEHLGKGFSGREGAKSSWLHRFSSFKANQPGLPCFHTVRGAMNLVEAINKARAMVTRFGLAEFLITKPVL